MPRLFGSIGSVSGLALTTLIFQRPQCIIHLDTTVHPPLHVAQVRLAPRGSESKSNKAKIIRELVSGSILGFGAGLFLRLFSRPLLIIVTLAGLGLQYAAFKGINLVSHKRLTGCIQNLGISYLKSDTVWKASFGLTFLIAGFLKFDDNMD